MTTTYFIKCVFFVENKQSVTLVILNNKFSTTSSSYNNTTLKGWGSNKLIRNLTGVKCFLALFVHMYRIYHHDLDVSKTWGIPKWMVYNGSKPYENG